MGVFWGGGKMAMAVRAFRVNKNVDLMPDVGHHCELSSHTFAIRCS